MIRIRIRGPRYSAMMSVLDVGGPDERVFEVLTCDTDGRTLLPVGHARSLLAWLGRVQAHLGLGFPDVLRDLRAALIVKLNELDAHPALWGHGMIGHVASLPITCWQIPGARRPHQLYSMRPARGLVEGFLVPTTDRQDRRVRITYWTFEPLEHGRPRPDSTMFRPAFATRRPRRDAAPSNAVAAQVRAALLSDAPERQAARSAVAEDGGDVP